MDLHVGATDTQALRYVAVCPFVAGFVWLILALALGRESLGWPRHVPGVALMAFAVLMPVVAARGKTRRQQPWQEVREKRRDRRRTAPGVRRSRDPAAHAAEPCDS